MSVTQLRRDPQGMKEAVKERPLDTLLRSKGEDLTDFELNRVLQDVPLRDTYYHTSYLSQPGRWYLF